jgi:hypothetical protein
MPDLNNRNYALYTLERPSRALSQHQAHQSTTKTLGVLDKSSGLPHFDILDWLEKRDGVAILYDLVTMQDQYQEHDAVEDL